MSFDLEFSDKAESDLIFHKKSGNVAVVNKIKKLLLEITEHPFDGTGKPETLKHELSGKWSRRISKEHRLVYEVFEVENSIKIHSAKGHYF